MLLLLKFVILGHLSQVGISQPFHFPQQQMHGQPHEQGLMPEIHAVPLSPSHHQPFQNHDQMKFGHPPPYFNMNHPPPYHPDYGGGGYQYHGGDDIPFGPEVKTDLSPELQERVLERVNELVPDIVEAIVQHEKELDELDQAKSDAGRTLTPSPFNPLPNVIMSLVVALYIRTRP